MPRIAWLLLALALSHPRAGASEPPPALRFRLTGDPVTLDWNLARSTHETYVIMNIMEGLVEEGEDGRVSPALAKSWEVSSDGTTYVFRLRDGVKWSDGRPLKAADFVESWRRLLEPKTNASYASFLFDVENAQAFHEGKLKDPAALGVKALDDSRFQVKLRSVVPHFLHLLSFWVTFPVRADLIKKHGAAWAKPGNLVTLGPYLLEEWSKGSKIRFKRNPLYREPASPGSPQSIDAVIEPDDGKARALFAQGKLDFLLNATTEDVLKARAGGEFPDARVEQFPYHVTYYLGFNVKNGPLRDVNVRRALALAIDREAIPAVLQGGQKAAKGWVPPGIAGHDSGAQLQGSLYDARGALAKAGYPEGNRFPKLVLWIDKFDGSDRLGTFLMKQLRGALGIEVEPKVALPDEFQSAVRAGRASIFVSRWGADYPDPSNYFEVFTSISGNNVTGWTNLDYDKRLEDARGTLDPARRLKLYAEAERILLQQDTVICPLFYRSNTALLGPRVASFHISPLNYLFLKTIRMK